jgi:peptidyl-prolyl cis-trans isomerase C
MKTRPKIIISLIILLAASAVLILARGALSGMNRQRQPAWTDKMQLGYANVLLSKGLYAEAASALEAYVAKGGSDKKELASICNKLGNIYMDLKDYEKALSSFYKSEMLDPDSDYKQEMNQKIVSALESLGLSQQAQYELESRTSLTPVAQKKENVAVRIGNREITNEEIDLAMSRLPEQVRNQLNTKEGKLNFIRDYVATEVLYEKGKKLGLDKDINIRTSVEEYKKHLVLQSLIGDEVKEELKVTPQDVELYYKANKEKYSTPERAKVSFIQVDNPSKSADASARLKQGKGKEIKQWIHAETVALPEGIGESREAVESILKQNKGGIAGPVQVNDKWYMFMVNEKETRAQMPFDKVKDRVESDYRISKQQQIIQSMIDKAMEQQEVQILYQPKAEDENTGK